MIAVFAPGGPIPQPTLFAMARCNTREAVVELGDAVDWLDSETIGRLPAAAQLLRHNVLARLAMARSLIEEAAAELDQAAACCRSAGTAAR